MKYTDRDTALVIGVNLSSNAYSTGVLPPLVPPCEGGKQENPVPFLVEAIFIN
jgi:hypothetical protein